MKKYLDLLDKIYHSGFRKQPHRKESGSVSQATLGLPCLHFVHDLYEGFPILTTRRLPWKNIQGELRAFIDGCDHNQHFVDRGCTFWTPWAREDGSLGPIYGVQWNRHGQMQHVLDALRNNPTDRRMVVSAWRPDEHDAMVLPPCHVLWIVTVYGHRLHMHVTQRSADFPIGVPCNIASYALLLELLSAWAGILPGILDLTFVDAHIYANQLQGVEVQLQRKPRLLPRVQSIVFRDKNNFRSWENVELEGWDPMPNDIDFGEVVVQ